MQLKYTNEPELCRRRQQAIKAFTKSISPGATEETHKKLEALKSK